MKKLLLLLCIAFTVIYSQAQGSAKDSVANADSVSKAMARVKAKAFQDSMENAFAAKAMYPLIKASKWSGVLPVSAIDEKPDATQQYKLLMEVTTGIKDSLAAREINGALAEVGRLLNIHLAAGISKKNLDIVVVAHGGVLRSFYNNAAYQKKYKTDNPNIALFNELLGAGVKFIACGQAMNFLEIEKSQLLPWMKVALSAQSELTSYQLKGYIHKDIDPNR